MSEAIGEHIFIIDQRDDYGDSTGQIGKIAVGAEGMIRLVEADPLFEPILDDIVTAVNNQPDFRIKVPPPPDAAQGGVWWQNVTRDDADLVDALCQYIEQKFALYCIADNEEEP